MTPELAAAEEQEAFEQGVVEQAAAEQALVELEAEQALAEEHLAKQIAVDQAAEPAPECVPDCFLVQVVVCVRFAATNNAKWVVEAIASGKRRSMQGSSFSMSIVSGLTGLSTSFPNLYGLP